MLLENNKNIVIQGILSPNKDFIVKAATSLALKEKCIIDEERSNNYNLVLIPIPQ